LRQGRSASPWLTGNHPAAEPTELAAISIGGARKQFRLGAMPYEIAAARI